MKLTYRLCLTCDYPGCRETLEGVPSFLENLDIDDVGAALARQAREAGWQLAKSVLFEAPGYCPAHYRHPVKTRKMSR